MVAVLSVEMTVSEIKDWFIKNMKGVKPMSFFRLLEHLKMCGFDVKRPETCRKIREAVNQLVEEGPVGMNEDDAKDFKREVPIYYFNRWTRKSREIFERKISRQKFFEFPPTILDLIPHGSPSYY